MSLNKNDVKDAIKSAFIAADGKLRAVWTLSAALIFWHAVVIIGALGTSSILSALFENWGVTSRNLQACPTWVQLIAAYQTQIFYCASSLFAALFGYFMLKRIRRGMEPARTMPVLGCLLGIMAGIFIATAIALIFFMCDSMRLETFELSFTADMLIMLAASFIISLGEGLLAFGYVREAVTGRGGRAAGYACAAIMFFMMENAYLQGWIVMLNTLLMAVVLCLISENLNLAAAIGLRTGWLWAISSLVAFPGSSNSMLTLYPVSEDMLTGGNAGPMSGITVTLICIVVIWAAIIRPGLSSFSAKLRSRNAQQ